MLDNHTDKAVSFLLSLLRPNLLFPTYIGADRELSQPQLEVYENFSTALIADFLPTNVSLKKRIFDNYFNTAQNNFFTFYLSNIYPPDTDTNSLIFSLLLQNGYPLHAQANRLLDEIVRYSPDGVAQVWLDSGRKPQYDHIVAINAQVLAVLLNRKGALNRNMDFIIEHLISGDFLSGTRYYHSPDTFLFFIVRLALIDKQFSDLISNQLKEAALIRRQTTCHPLDLAQRVIVFKYVGIDFAWEQEKLLSLQTNQGALPADALFRFGAKNGFFGGQAISTAFFIKALNFKK